MFGDWVLVFTEFRVLGWGCRVRGGAHKEGWRTAGSLSRRLGMVTWFRKVDVRLPGKGNSNSHGARPVHLIITMIKWTRTSRLSIKNSLSGHLVCDGRVSSGARAFKERVRVCGSV